MWRREAVCIYIRLECSLKDINSAYSMKLIPFICQKRLKENIEFEFQSVTKGESIFFHKKKRDNFHNFFYNILQLEQSYLVVTKVITKFSN